MTTTAPTRKFERSVTALTGRVVLPDHPKWDEARLAWNLAVDQQPTAIVFPESAEDVLAAIELATALGLRVTAQGTGHNARPLGERPLSNYHVAVAHMRDQAYLTGKEFRQIIAFLRRWQDVGPPTPDVGPSPKRFVFGSLSGKRSRAAATPFVQSVQYCSGVTPLSSCAPDGQNLSVQAE